MTMKLLGQTIFNFNCIIKISPKMYHWNTFKCKYCIFMILWRAQSRFQELNFVKCACVVLRTFDHCRRLPSSSCKLLVLVLNETNSV